MPEIIFEVPSATDSHVKEKPTRSSVEKALGDLRQAILDSPLYNELTDHPNEQSAVIWAALDIVEDTELALLGYENLAPTTEALPGFVWVT